jgi:hypothetical protein
MLTPVLERSHSLKQALNKFVLESEGELAQALESYVAKQLRRSSGDNIQRDMIVDTFICDGIGDKSPIDLFIQSHTDLSADEINLLQSWHRSFIGLFVVDEIKADGFDLRNWLTTKHYIVKPNNPQLQQDMSRFKVGEILLTRISPVTDTEWIFSGPCTVMGKLGKPKLAVAIGNFKDNYRNQLYSDAPDLLEEAWESVEVYHDQFVDFFGADEITMPGYQLNKKMGEFQEIINQKQLERAGIDTSKSIAEMAEDAGVDDEDIKAAVAEMGGDSSVVSHLLNSQNATSKMVMPKVDLPVELRKAEQVTAISHPRWGQMFLPTYSKMQAILSADDINTVEGAKKLIRFYLEDKSINAFIWHRLAKQYPQQLEALLQITLQRPEFNLKNDLDAVLESYGKIIEPELPEIASVPLHLHNLFQEAVAEVHKPKSKSKNLKPVAKGFQRD